MPNEKPKSDSAPAVTSVPDQSNVVIIPPEAIQKAAEQGQPLTLTIHTVHAGPLPAPDTLRAYDSVHAGLSKIIVEQFQAEAKHRRGLQSRGQIGAFVIALTSIVCGSILGYALGSGLAALAVIGPVCGGIGTAQLLEYWFKH